MILKCIAIDDEILALNKMERFISKVEFLKLMKCFDNAPDAIKYIKDNSIDLVFLDIEMPEMSGFQVLNTIEDKPYVILTTAYDRYALKSYDFEVNDYLLKPIQFDRFIKSVERIYSLAQKDKVVETIDTGEPIESDHIHVKSSGNLIKIYINDILYIEGLKDYLAIHTKQKRVVSLLSFNKLLEKLPVNQFVRVHKSYIAAFNKITEFGTDEISIDDKKIPVSKTYKEDLKKLTKDLNL